MILRFTLPIVPRTKKTSSQIVSFGKACGECGRREFQKLVPSEQFLAFEALAVSMASPIRAAIESSGRVILPVVEPVSIKAEIYRDRETGDWNGYTDALADVLQEPMYKGCCVCGKGCVIGLSAMNADAPKTCSQCGRIDGSKRFVARDGRQSRKGLGIIANDAQIQDWDGTRLRKDANDPRIEITITTVTMGSLFA